MAEMHEFLCPHCFYKHLAPINTTGRYTVMRGSYQMLIDLKNKELDSIRIPYQLFTLFDLDNEKVDRFVQDFIKYGTTEPVPDEERQFLQPITPPRYRIWANRSKCWQCPKCGHKMIRISQFGIMVD